MKGTLTFKVRRLSAAGYCIGCDQHPRCT